MFSQRISSTYDTCFEGSAEYEAAGQAFKSQYYSLVVQHARKALALSMQSYQAEDKDQLQKAENQPQVMLIALVGVALVVVAVALILCRRRLVRH